MATYKQDTGISIQDAFNKFNEANPEMLLLIVKECDRAIRAKKKKFSIKAIINYIRWNIFLETAETTLFSNKGEAKKFKINDAYSSRYARLIITKYPHIQPFIEMREIRSL